MRFGGEEFAMIMPNSSDASAMAGLCLQAIRDLEIEHQHSSVSDILTISIGCCSLAVKHDLSVDDLVKRADKALYLAKDSGRNCFK